MDFIILDTHFRLDIVTRGGATMCLGGIRVYLRVILESVSNIFNI